MSYILDALRRADADRVRGGVPGLHAQPIPAAEGEPVTGPTRWPWIVAAAALLAVAVMAWLQFGRHPDVPVAQVAVPMPASPADARRDPAPASAPIRPAASTAVPSPVERRLPKPRAEPERAVPAPPLAAARPAASSPEAAAERRLYTQAELPDEVRRMVPTLAIQGSRYSEDKASRVLIVNGSVLHEGDALNADVKLEQIRLKSAVFEIKGYRFALTY